ncbi:hypothetical protein OHS18_12080 [Amycolatopsis sp. NBC_00355]|uniref:hypothetical protein n=1 Tax=Amycolatopsis sp. NBC_00355 TaxID=2975957 RepID=UPI002E257348
MAHEVKTTLTVLSGAGVPLPVPADVTAKIETAEVRLSESGRSGFQLVVADGRSGIAAVADYPVLSRGLFERFHRVVVVVTVAGLPHVLIDGVVTCRELTVDPPKLVVTGEDLGVLMDVEERNAEYPAQSDAVIAARLLARYGRYGIVPLVVPPPSADVPTPVERVAVQTGTDLGHLTAMAARHGYVFHLAAGPLPRSSTAYWGPAVPSGDVAPAVSYGAAPFGNVESLSFRVDGLAPASVRGFVQDRRTNRAVPVVGLGGGRPPLAVRPVRLTNGAGARTVSYRDSGASAAEALATANARAEESADAVTATGKVDSTRYPGVLRPRQTVGVRGVGWQHDGLYRVRGVTHSIARGSYTQDFTLTREGVGSTTVVVRP